MTAALYLHSDGDVETIELPDDGEEQRTYLRQLMEGSVDRAVYHREALFHLHGSGAQLQMPLNLVAWSLACVWRDLDSLYGLHGAVVITGPESAHGVLGDLSQEIAEEVRAAAAAVAECATRWKSRPPGCNTQATVEVLTAVRTSIEATTGR